MMAPTKNYSYDGLGWKLLCLFLGSSGLNWLVVFFCFSIQVVLFDIPGFKCHNTLSLLSSCLCVVIGFICDLFVARNNSWMS